jgi:hypothetical protein
MFDFTHGSLLEIYMAAIKLIFQRLLSLPGMDEVS